MVWYSSLKWTCTGLHAPVIQNNHITNRALFPPRVTINRNAAINLNLYRLWLEPTIARCYAIKRNSLWNRAQEWLKLS